MYVNKNYFQSAYTCPRQISPEGYDIVLNKSLKEQLLVWLQARENCLNANQQYLVPALLKMMGYQITIADPEENERKTRDTELTKTLKEVKKHVRDANYCDFSEGISPECVALHDAVKNRNASADPDAAQRLSNQMRCLQAGFAAGLNPQETNDLVNKDLTALVQAKLLLPNDDPNQLIANYLNQYGDLIAFRKRV